MSIGTLNIAVTFYTQTCIVSGCGVQFAVTQEFDQRRRQDHKNFYCPNGHSQHYPGETPEQRKIRELEQQRAALEKRAKTAERDLYVEHEARQAVQRRLSATRGVLTRTKNRVARGVCPCCNRTFANLGRHMAGQHPGYAGGEDA